LKKLVIAIIEVRKIAVINSFHGGEAKGRALSAVSKDIALGADFFKESFTTP
jgi:hypothetical protein